MWNGGDWGAPAFIDLFTTTATSYALLSAEDWGLLLIHQIRQGIESVYWMLIIHEEGDVEEWCPVKEVFPAS